MKKYSWSVIPILLFVALFIFLWRGLSLEPQKLPSTFIEKPAPEFSLPALGEDKVMVTHLDLQSDKVTLLSVWATWCMYCKMQHALLMDIAASGRVNLIGLNYHDRMDKALEWLADYGNPYEKVAFDRYGQVGIDYGVYGTPETFIIDYNGVIREKIIGPITLQTWEEQWLPFIERLEQTY